MDLELICETVAVAATSYKTVPISIEDANDGDILNHFKIEDIISHFDDDKILDVIGSKRVMEYFDLIENPEE